MSLQSDHPVTTPASVLSCESALTPADRVRRRRSDYLAALWVVSMPAVVLGLEHWQPASRALAIAIACIPGVLMAVAFLAYADFLRRADANIRRIQTTAMGVGFGTGIWVMLSWSLLERVGAPEINVGGVVLVMMLSMIVARLYLKRRS